MKNEDSINRSSPLKIVWNFISVIGTILGLISISDDFVAWKNVIEKILDGYRSFVYFPFGLLRINVNDHIIDYLFIGSLCGVSYSRALTFAYKNGYLSKGKYPTGVKIFYFLLYLLFWPFGISITIKQILFKEADIKEWHIKIRFVQWLIASLLGFISILIWNAV